MSALITRERFDQDSTLIQDLLVKHEGNINSKRFLQALLAYDAILNKINVLGFPSEGFENTYCSVVVHILLAELTYYDKVATTVESFTEIYEYVNHEREYSNDEMILEELRLINEEMDTIVQFYFYDQSEFPQETVQGTPKFIFTILFEKIQKEQDIEFVLDMLSGNAIPVTAFCFYCIQKLFNRITIDFETTLRKNWILGSRKREEILQAILTVSKHVKLGMYNEQAVIFLEEFCRYAVPIINDTPGEIESFRKRKVSS